MFMTMVECSSTFAGVEVLQELVRLGQQTLASTRRMERSISALTSSFHETPLIVRNSEEYVQRPAGRRGGARLSGGTKVERYVKAWYDTLQTPQNSCYGIAKSDGQIRLTYQQQHNATLRIVYECDATQLAIKSAFLVYGMLEYDMESFEEHIAENAIAECRELSPENSPLSKYAPPATV